MKGIGRISGWKVIYRGVRDINWKNIRTGKEVAFWRVGLGTGKGYGYEISLNFPGGKLKFTKSLERAREIVKEYMTKNK